MPCRDWMWYGTVLVGRMMYNVWLAPAADVEMDGVRRAAVCDHQRMLIALSDDVDPSLRQVAVESIRMQALELVRSGRVAEVPAGGFEPDGIDDVT